ncbi:MAG: pentapeptide repeat-containing protein [Anaerolineae bacterium]|nr:pentapeptide repeat-containing protein [Anaerolineae bacterium]
MTEAEPTHQPTRQVSRHRLIIMAIVAGVVLSLVIAFAQVRFGWNWTGFSTRTLWDWLELLLVPLLLAAAGAYLNYLDNRRKRREDDERARQQKREDDIRREQQEREEELDEQRQQREALEARRRDEERYREETVRKYFDDMAYLMVEKGLLALVQSVEPGKTIGETKDPTSPTEPDPEKLVELLKNPVWNIAQTRTITVLRRMSYRRAVDSGDTEEQLETKVDVQRANEILDFLRDSGLLVGVGSILRQANLVEIDLKGVYLSQVNLSGAALFGADLSGAFLNDINLNSAYLVKTNLSNAHLGQANLSCADLFQASLPGADLGAADFSGASLGAADLSRTFLVSTDLSGADLGRADLSGANLQYAILVDAKIVETTFDSKTILPNAIYVDTDEDGNPIYDKYYNPDLGLEQMERYTNPNHPDFWQPEWAKQQANNNDEDT